MVNVLRKVDRQRQSVSLLIAVSSDIDPSSSAEMRESADSLDLAVVTVSLLTSVSKKLSDDTVNISEFSAFSLELADTANWTALSSQNGVRIRRRSCRDVRLFSSSLSSSETQPIFFVYIRLKTICSHFSKPKEVYENCLLSYGILPVLLVFRARPHGKL